MIYKWNEVKYVDFIDFLVQILEEKEECFVNKVVEVQESMSIKVDDPGIRRVFIGNNINLESCDFSNKEDIELIFQLESIMKMLKTDSIGVCSLDLDCGPQLIPLPFGNNNINTLRGIFFGEKELIEPIFRNLIPKSYALWYFYKDGNKTIDIGNKGDYKPDQKYVRFRTLDFDTWKDMVQDWKRRKTELYVKDDLVKDEIHCV